MKSRDTEKKDINGKDKKRKRQPMGLGRKIILVLCLIVFVGSASVLLDYFLNSSREQGDLESLADLKVERDDLVTDKGTVIGKYVDLYLANPDIIGWVTIKGTKIDYPVMQTPDKPEYYLRRNFNKESAVSGTPFMDANSNIFTPTSNFLIYGHNIKSGTMFHDLLKYKDESFYNKHKKFKFDTIYKGGQGTYEIVAAGYSQIYPEDSTEFKYYQHAGITSEEDFNAYVKGVKALSSYDTGVTPEYGDQLVTLSTCAYHVKNGRFFVVGRRTDAKQVVPQ
ncbi:MAG: class B sortase [Bacillota bacterium]|nr:class B sortase [Bacillota bacterium]